jgi:phage shock protein PspC (stress-responsive transcriptional regulator)
MRKFYRNTEREDRWIGGLCGGLGEMMGIDPFFIRLLFVILFFTPFPIIIIYIISCLITESKYHG